MRSRYSWWSRYACGAVEVRSWCLLVVWFEVLVVVEVRLWCGRGTLVVRSRGRGTLSWFEVRSWCGGGTARGAVEVRLWCSTLVVVEVRLWCGRGTLVVRSRGRGTLSWFEVRSWCGGGTARGAVEVRLWCSTLVVRLRYDGAGTMVRLRYTLPVEVVQLRYARGVVEVRSWCGRGMVVQSRYGGAVKVRSWCGLRGMLQVCSPYGSGSMRYFNFLSGGAVHMLNIIIYVVILFMR